MSILTAILSLPRTLRSIEQYLLHLGNLVNHINQRTKAMPTVDELKAAVAEEVVKERAQHLAAVEKAVADALANLPENISEASKEAILASIRSVVPDTPTA